MYCNYGCKKDVIGSTGGASNQTRPRLLVVDSPLRCNRALVHKAVTTVPWITTDSTHSRIWEYGICTL